MDVSQVAERDLNIDSTVKKHGETKIDATAESTVDVDIEYVGSPVLYSKRSIFYMTLFSGLAIGSDAYNSASMGQLLLLFGLLYPDTLSVATQAQLTNTFIIGLVSPINKHIYAGEQELTTDTKILGMLSFGFISDHLGRKSGAVLTTLFLSVGIIMSAVSHGKNDKGMFWMLTVSRGIAGFG